MVPVCSLFTSPPLAKLSYWKPKQTFLPFLMLQYISVPGWKLLPSWINHFTLCPSPECWKGFGQRSQLGHCREGLCQEQTGKLRCQDDTLSLPTQGQLQLPSLPPQTSAKPLPTSFLSPNRQRTSGSQVSQAVTSQSLSSLEISGLLSPVKRLQESSWVSPRTHQATSIAFTSLINISGMSNSPPVILPSELSINPWVSLTWALGYALHLPQLPWLI